MNPEITTLNPLAEALKKKGNTAFKARKYHEAINHYSGALTIQDKGSYYSNRAFCYMKLNKLDDALRDALKGIEVEPEFFRGYSRASQVYLMRGEIKKAGEVLSRGIQVVPEGDKLRKELDELQVIALHVEKMKNLIEKKMYKEAVSPLEMIQEKCKEDDSLLLKKVELLCWANEAQDALKYVESEQQRMRQMVPTQFETQMAIVARYNNEIEKAKKYIQIGLRNDPDNGDLRVLFKAIKKLETAKKTANGLFKQGKYNEAILKYDEAVLLDPENSQFIAVLLANKATCLKKLNKKKEAIDTLREAVKRNPKYGKGYLKIADLEEEANDYEAARESIVKAKELDPSLQVDGRLQRVTQKANSQEKTDYYKTLGINKNATPKEIKKAYRKLAKMWHPDRHSNNDQDKRKATKKFKDIVEAHEVLSNSEKRQRYDLGGFDMANGSGRGHHQSFHMGGGSPFPSDIFSMFMGGGQRSGGFGGRSRRSEGGNRTRNMFFSNGGGRQANFDDIFNMRS